MCWHKWTKWSDPYVVKIIHLLHRPDITSDEVRQRKNCKKCGKIKIRRVSS